MTALNQPSLGIDVYDFRAVMRRHAATVTVVTAPGNPPVGFTATSFTSVSLHPQLVSFCLDSASSSWPTLRNAEHVAIHILASGQQAVASTFATSHIDRFTAHGRWRPGPYGLPVLEGTLAVLICAVVEHVTAGDHVIVLSRPVSADHHEGEPLLYCMGSYTTVAR
ncbi:MAG TPA: flavin reductase family protein [Candidatus Limnocylindrales bacterium]|nr:flavin reductase family protein [Candidatus Limnocylindrales bacterium]